MTRGFTAQRKIRGGNRGTIATTWRYLEEEAKNVNMRSNRRNRKRGNIRWEEDNEIYYNIYKMEISREGKTKT